VLLLNTPLFTIGEINSGAHFCTTRLVLSAVTLCELVGVLPCIPTSRHLNHLFLESPTHPRPLQTRQSTHMRAPCVEADGATKSTNHSQIIHSQKEAGAGKRQTFLQCLLFIIYEGV